MTIDERNKLSHRDRIKQYIEFTMRKLCDDMTDSDEPLTKGIIDSITKVLKDYSEIYKNMGFDKENEKVGVVPSRKEMFDIGVTEFAKWLIDKHITDFTDIVDLAIEFRRIATNDSTTVN